MRDRPRQGPGKPTGGRAGDGAGPATLGTVGQALGLVLEDIWGQERIGSQGRCSPFGSTEWYLWWQHVRGPWGRGASPRLGEQNVLLFPARDAKSLSPGRWLWIRGEGDDFRRFLGGGIHRAGWLSGDR